MMKKWYDASGTVMKTKKSSPETTITAFSGFETDVELDNVSTLAVPGIPDATDHPILLFRELVHTLEVSKIPQNEKKKLFREMLTFLSGRRKNSAIKADLVSKTSGYAGDRAAGLFSQLAAAVSSGLVLRQTETKLSS